MFAGMLVSSYSQVSGRIVAVQVLVVHRERVAHRFQVGEDGDGRQRAADVRLDAFQFVVAPLHRPLGWDEHVHGHEAPCPGLPGPERVVLDAVRTRSGRGSA